MTRGRRPWSQRSRAGRFEPGAAPELGTARAVGGSGGAKCGVMTETRSGVSANELTLAPQLHGDERGHDRVGRLDRALTVERTSFREVKRLADKPLADLSVSHVRTLHEAGPSSHQIQVKPRVQVGIKPGFDGGEHQRRVRGSMSWTEAPWSSVNACMT